MVLENPPGCLLKVSIAAHNPLIPAHTPLIPALGRQKPEDLCEFKASLVYRASSRIDSIATEKPCLEKPKKERKTDRQKERKKERKKETKKERKRKKRKQERKR